MGWFSVDKRRESTNYTTNNTTAADNGGIAATGNATVNVMDGGAFSFAAKESGAALGFAAKEGGAAFDFAAKEGGAAFDFGGRALDLTQHINDNALKSLSQSFAETSRIVSATAAEVINKTSIDSGERVQSLIKMGAWLAFGVVLIWSFKK